jgi:mono/diheme cytochrome c family protein
LSEASPVGSLVHLGCGPDFTLVLQPGEAAVIPATYFVPENAPVKAGAFHLNYTVYSFEALSPDPRQVGRQIYASRCVSCHGSRGLGDGPVARYLDGGVGDLAPALRRKGDGLLLDAIASGVGPMPAFALVLSDSERQALLLHLRDLGRGAP